MRGDKSHAWFFLALPADGDLVRRLIRVITILDKMVPEDVPTEPQFRRLWTVVLRHVRRQQVAQAIVTMVDGMREHPFWVRGYLLLATMYHDVHETGAAIATLKAGITMSRALARSWTLWERGLEGAQAALSATRVPLWTRGTVYRSYEEVLRYQLMQVLIDAQQYEDVFQWWADPCATPCASCS